MYFSTENYIAKGEFSMSKDFRNIANGVLIPSYDYADQPEIILAPDGTMICAVTTAQGVEGASGTFVGISRSYDNGKTWSELERLDDCPYESSYSTLIMTDYGRIYCFYDLNDEGFTNDDVFTEPDGKRAKLWRYDMGFGIFCFKYSDDNGKTWSKERYSIPMRTFDIDLDNPLTCRGKKRFLFWNVSKPFFFEGKFYHAMINFQYKYEDFMYRSEGVLLVSDNLAHERDPEKINWETLPDGTKGIAAPKNAGTVAEEQCFVPLSDGSLFCVFRTVSGHSSCTYSRDGGHTWAESDFMRYPDGRPVKHVRAANFVWKCSNGKYLYWFHNNGGKTWDGRNPAWLLAGTEKQTPDGMVIEWSEPEIGLYDDRCDNRISYPDFFENDGKYYISETQKSITRFHEIPAAFLEDMWNQKSASKAKEDLLVSSEVFTLPNITLEDNILTIILDVDFTNIPCSTVLLDTTSGKLHPAGIKLSVNSEGYFKVSIGTCNTLSTTVFQKTGVMGARRTIALTVDCKAGIIYALSDGKFLDGADEDRYGWQKFPKDIFALEASSGKMNTVYLKSARFFLNGLSVSRVCMDYNCDAEK